MRFNQISKFLLIALILSGLIHKLLLINTLPVQIDELCALARTCNNSIDILAEFRTLNPEKIYTLNETLEVFTPKSKSVNFIQDSAYYIQNFSKLTDHPPVADVLGKLSIINNQIGVINLRYLAFTYWLISILVIYLFFRQLQIERKTILLALIFYSSLTTCSLSASFAKGYMLQTLLCFTALLFYLQAGKKNNLLSLLFVHISFLVHYFSIMFLVPWLFWIDLRKKQFGRGALYLSSLVIYLPTAIEQKNHSREHWIGEFSLWKEFKLLYKQIFNLYDLNFSKTFSLLILIGLIYLLLKSKNKTTILKYFLISISPLMALSIYDILGPDYLVRILRYSISTLPFVGLVLALLVKDKNIHINCLSILLLLNIWIPNLNETKILNSSIYSDVNGSITKQNFEEKSLFLLANYHARNLIILQAMQAHKMNQKAIQGFNKDKLKKNQIQIATVDSFKNQEELVSFLKKEEFKCIYLLPFRKDLKFYKKFDLSNFNCKLLKIEA